MTGQQLKNSILQEAICGRLVISNPKEGKASDQLVAILTDINKSLPKKKQRFLREVVAEDMPETLPDNWTCFYIGDVFFTTSGGTPSKGIPQYYGGNIPWVRSGELKNKYLYDSEIKITELAIEKSSAKYFPVDTVAVAMYGATIGDTTIFKAPMTTNQAVCGLFPVNGILPEYIYYFFLAKKKALTEVGFGSGQPNISQDKIKNTVFPLPPLAEQKRIVAKLEELLPIVDKYGLAQKELEELNAHLPQKLRQSILQDAILGKLVKQSELDEEADSLISKLQYEKKITKKQKLIKNDEVFILEDGALCVPSSWKVVSLRSVCELSDGEKRSETHVCMDAKFLRGKSEGTNVTSGKFVRKDDVMILVDGENSGETFIAPQDGYMGSTFKKLWISSEMYRPYVLYVIRFYKELLRNSKKGAAIPHLNKDIFYNLEIGIPPLAEQKRIVAKIEELFNVIAK